MFYSNCIFISHIDVKLYFDGEDQFLDVNGRMGYKLFIGEKVQSQLMIKDIKLLDHEQDHDNQI